MKATAITAGFALFPTGSVNAKRNLALNAKIMKGRSEGFIDENFLLQSEVAEELYHKYAKSLPIIDYHNHMPPSEIAEDKNFENLTKIWLDGDHYKWRAMRANGINEKYITGDATDFEKFTKWAETVPYTLRNPLYHWTHLELKRYFGIVKILNPSTAKEIYDEATALLKTKEFSAQNLIKSRNVEVLCTTDDPSDDLSYHQKIKDQGYSVTVLPAWRPDKAMAAENTEVYNTYIDKLAKSAETSIFTFLDLVDALKKRQKLFNEMGCKLSDHGLETFYAEEYTEAEVNEIFKKVRSGQDLNNTELLKFKSALLFHLGEMNHTYGWTQQFHVGPLRNNNEKMFREIGPDTGFDSIGDLQIAKPMSKYFSSLVMNKSLTKTIVYNLNPRDNEVMATMVGNFNDGLTPGKMQYGSAWWFLDQKDGIEKQLNVLSNMGLLGRFVGMTTDSRSFLSYSRHEYFRRVLCNLIATDVESGELPNDIDYLGETVQNICYYNAKEYFKFTV
ncbi:MAG: glucuronate isomerase [Balneolaceae bacterium]